jgi:hypothetical protein
MIRNLMLGTVATVGLVASTAFGAARDVPQVPCGPEFMTASAEARADLWVVWYFEYGRWLGIGPLNYYDASMVLADLHRKGYRAYIASP